MESVKGEELRKLVKVNTTAVKEEDVLTLLAENDAVLKDYFALKSGHYSRYFVNMDKICHHPIAAEAFSNEFAERFKDKEIDLVVCSNSAAMNCALDTATAIDAKRGRNRHIKRIVVERDEYLDITEAGVLNYFDIKIGNRALIINDMMASGKNLRHICKMLTSWRYGVKIEGIGMIASRYNKETFGELRLPIPTEGIEVLVQFNFEHYKRNPWPDKKILSYAAVESGEVPITV